MTPAQLAAVRFKAEADASYLDWVRVRRLTAMQGQR